MHRAFVFIIIGVSIFIIGFSFSSEHTRLWHSIQSGWRSDIELMSLPNGFDLVMWIISIVGFSIAFYGLWILGREIRPYGNMWFFGENDLLDSQW